MILRPRLSGFPTGPFEINRNSAQAAGLDAWWPVINNRMMLDFSGNQHNITFPGSTNDPAFSMIPEVGPALLFDGNDDYLAVPSLDAYTFSSFTISCWYRSNQTSSTDDQYIIVNENTVNSDIVAFGPTDDGGHTDQLRLRMNGPVASQDLFYSTTDIVDMVLHHLAATWDQPSGAVRIYVDGKLETSDTYTSAAIQPNETFYIGDQPGNTEQVNGWLSDLRIYNRALSANEIYQLYDPATRWELYKPRKPIFVVSGPAVAAGRATKNTDASPLGLRTAMSWRLNSL